MGMPTEYARVLEMARGRPGSESEIETLELQAAHTDVGAYLVGLWGLPNTSAEATRKRTTFTQIPPSTL